MAMSYSQCWNSTMRPPKCGYLGPQSATRLGILNPPHSVAQSGTLFSTILSTAHALTQRWFGFKNGKLSTVGMC